jgi:hypothetical protein
MTTLSVTFKCVGSFKVLKQFDFDFDQHDAPRLLQIAAAHALCCETRAARIVYVDPDRSFNLDLALFPNYDDTLARFLRVENAWATLKTVIATKKASSTTSKLVQVPSIALLVTRFSRELLWVDSTFKWASRYDVFDRLPKEARASRRVALVAVKYDSFVLQEVCVLLQNDQNFVLAVCRANGLALQKASDAFKTDRDIVLAAVQQNGRALKHASSNLQADRDIVLVAVNNYGCALEHASSDLRADRKVVRAAVHRDYRALYFAQFGDAEIKALYDEARANART